MLKLMIASPLCSFVNLDFCFSHVQRQFDPWWLPCLQTCIENTVLKLMNVCPLCLVMLCACFCGFLFACVSLSHLGPFE